MPHTTASQSSPIDILRLLNDLLRLGTIAHIQTNPERVRVTAGDLLTDWLPWFNLRAGAIKTAFKPSIGEQCMVLSPGGNLRTGVVLLGINSDQNPPLECTADDFIIDVPTGGKLLLRCGSSTLEISESNIKAISNRIDLN